MRLKWSLVGFLFIVACGSIAAWSARGAAPCAADTPNQQAFKSVWLPSNSVWNQTIGGSPVVQSFSTAAISAYSTFVGPSYGINFNLSNHTMAVIEAPPGTPGITVNQRGTAPVWHLTNVPIVPRVLQAADYFAATGDTDASVCLYSDDLGVFFAMGGTQESGGVVTFSSSAIMPMNGIGWWKNSLNPWIGGSGSSCGGVIRPQEWVAGVINHALSMAWPQALNLNAGVFPATTSDGTGTDVTQNVPEGSLFQLDPTLSDGALTGMGVPASDLPICHALQTYGAYEHDSTGVSAAVIYFQSTLGAPTQSVYPGYSAPLPNAILTHMRIIAGPAPSSAPPLDTQYSQQQFIYYGNHP